MKIDLVKVNSQIQKLEELRRIASDPELLALLETVMVKGSNLNPPAAIRDFTAMPQTVPPSPERPSTRPSDGANATAKKGELQRAVREAIRAMDIDKPFSGYLIARRMQNDGYKFASSKPGIAVIDALKALVNKGVVKVFMRGGGSQPTLFIRVQGGERLQAPN
jgi:hypothetical protein